MGCGGREVTWSLQLAVYGELFTSVTVNLFAGEFIGPMKASASSFDDQRIIVAEKRCPLVEGDVG